jgi:hypothetical protein
MKLERQVCSFPLAKRLEELGLNQPTVFQWRTNYDGEHLETFLVQEENYESKGDNERGEAAGSFLTWAPTVAELGETLPWFVTRDEEDYWLELIKNGPNPVVGKTWSVGYQTIEDEEGETDMLSEVSYGDSEADARAMMLIYLLENKIITL